jgi:glutamate--cysteine ligase catalytic subunit
MEMTMDEVINGRGDGAAFPGLMGVVNAYLNSLNVDVATKCDLRRYLDLIKWRARGESSSSFHYLLVQTARSKKLTV